MAVVLKGEQQTDGSFVFAASSEQVNSLNKMCDGNLNTQLSDVQFGMKMKSESLDLSNITASFAFPYIERIRGFNLPTETITLPEMSTLTMTITNKSYNNLSELFDEVCAYFTYDLEWTMNLGDGEASFRQELVYDKALLNNYVLSLTYNFKCIKTTSAKYSAEYVNNMYTKIYSYGSKMSSTSYIESEQLMKILKFDDIISAYQPLIKSGSLQINSKRISWRFFYSDQGTMYDNNAVFFSPINAVDNATYYVTNGLKTGLTTYKPDDTIYQFKTKQFFSAGSPKFLYFDCPQLSTQNIALPDGRILNIIAKTVCTAASGQYFIMSTTEPLRELTIQNVINTKFVVKVYDESFEQKKNYTKTVMILKSSVPKSRQVVNYYQGRGKLQVNIMNVTH